MALTNTLTSLVDDQKPGIKALQTALEDQGFVDLLAVFTNAMSLALEALEKERQMANGRRDFSLLSIRAIEALNEAFKTYEVATGNH